MRWQGYEIGRQQGVEPLVGWQLEEGELAARGRQQVEVHLVEVQREVARQLGARLVAPKPDWEEQHMVWERTGLREVPAEGELRMSQLVEVGFPEVAQM